MRTCMQKLNLVVGANGGIGRALVDALAKENPDIPLIAIARAFDRELEWPENVVTKALDSQNEAEIEYFVGELSREGKTVQRAFCSIGVLHDKDLSPEKKLEDLSQDQLLRYFNVNAILPALWLKHLIRVVDSEKAVFTFISARVGSIADNQLGGWYGYRASKAALNQLVKTASVEYGRRSKNTVLVCYQPGTVDTPLSKPFQNNVKKDMLFDTQFAVKQLLSVTANLPSPPNCHFVDWQGNAIDW